MADPQPIRPWWKRKRWIAAGLAWLLLVVYPVSSGPAFYCVGRGWIGLDTFWRIYAPLRPVLRGTDVESDSAVYRYLEWWGMKAWKDVNADGLI